jgi:hypothetical protein
MKHFLFLGPALLAVLAGSLLLPLLAWASLQPPSTTRLNYCAAVLAQLFGPRTAWVALAGLGAIVAGLAAGLHALFLAGADRRERKEALPAFGAALIVCSVAMIALLAAVTWFGQQAGEVVSLLRWVGR